MAKNYTDKDRPKGYYMVNGKRRYWTGSNWRVAPRVRDVVSAPKTDPKVLQAAKQDLKTAAKTVLRVAQPLANRIADNLKNPLPSLPSVGKAISNAQSSSTKPKPKPENTAAAKPKPKPQPTEAAKPKPKPQPTPAKPKPKPKPTPAKPKPKPKPETVNGKTVKRVGPVSTPADKPKMNKLKIAKATASTEKAYLKYLQEEAKRKSLEQAKKNRARRNSGPRGPRG